MNIERGTKPYMAPEILLEGKLHCATMEDLKAIDIWALGMIFFSIINPDVEFPYEIELNSSTEKPPSLAAKYFEKMLREKVTMKSKLQASKKYQKRQFSEWAHLEKLYLKCTAFDSFLRPCAEDVLMELNGNDEKNHQYCQETPVWKKKSMTNCHQHLQERPVWKRRCITSPPIATAAKRQVFLIHWSNFRL